MIQASENVLPFELAVQEQAGGRRLAIRGALPLTASSDLRRALSRALESPAPGKADVAVDLTELTQADGASLAILLDLRAQARAAGGEIAFEGASEETARLLTLYGCPGEHVCQRAAPRSAGLLEHMGDSTVDVLRTFRDILGFQGDMLASAAAAIRRPRSVDWGDIPSLAERAGANGAPIVLLINFLIGWIIALQAGFQLEQFGANVFVADMVGLSIVRELAPLMTAIIVAGRSGAAFAAELGTMRVSEEIDALRAMWLDPLRQLVFPRVIALTLVVPALALLGMIMGCVGGLIVALYSLDLTLETYTHRLQDAVSLADLFVGLIKTAVFAATIALISCQRGLATRGGAAGVGGATTSSVVTILFSLILLDALFTALFHALGI